MHEKIILLKIGIIQLRKGDYGRGIFRKFVKLLFHGNYAVPCAEFVAGVRGKAAFGEAELFVHSHGGRIVLHNEGIANAKALFAEDNEQPLQKQGAYSAPLCALVNIDGILHSPTVCGAGIEGSAVGVAENNAVFLVNKPRIFPVYFFNSAAELLDGRYFVLEGIGCVLYIRRIDA